VKGLALNKRAILAMGARYPVVRLGGGPTILKHWRCANDGAVISGDYEYYTHISFYPSHQIVNDTS
jgi:hypothetical protein